MNNWVKHALDTGADQVGFYLITWGFVVQCATHWSYQSCTKTWRCSVISLLGKDMERWSLSWNKILVPKSPKKHLTCGLVTPYGHTDLGQHWSRRWLVVWRHQTITWTLLTSHQWGSVAFTWEQFHNESSSYYSLWSTIFFLNYCLISRATSHYLSQCWRSFMPPHGVARPHELTWPTLQLSVQSHPTRKSSSRLRWTPLAGIRWLE